MVDVKTINIRLPDYVAGESVIVNTADADIVAADVANGKIAYGANGRIVGTHECTGGGITDGIVATYTGGNVTKLDVYYSHDIDELNIPRYGDNTTVTQIDFHGNGTAEIKAFSDNCFSGMTAITGITIPQSVTSLGEGCFTGCSALTSTGLTDNITTLGESCYSDCTSLTSIQFGNGITSIPDFCFYGCTALTSVELTDNITSLAFSCFDSCTSLTSIGLTESLTQLPELCFFGCEALTNIEIPSTVTEIGNQCFYNCTALTEIHFKGEVPPTVGNNAFDNIGEGCLIYVPTGTVDAYKEADNMPDPETYIYTEE